MGTLARHGSNEAVTSATAEAVWRIVADVTRVGEWSHECRGARWVKGGTAAAPGVRFRGRNESGIFRWSRSCEFTLVDPPHELVWVTGGWWGRFDSTEWRIVLEPVPEGTRIIQRYDVVHVTPGLDRLYWMFIKAHRDRRDALAEDLQRLARLAATRHDTAREGSGRSHAQR
jgi:hypothetical protein